MATPKKKPRAKSTKTVSGAKVRTDITTAFVSTPGFSTLSGHKTLITSEDDVDRQITGDTYERMENDPTIAKARKILLTHVLADELQMSPGGTEEQVGPKEFQKFVEVMEFCERVILGLDKPYRDTCEQLLGNAIPYGHGIAETEWEYRVEEEFIGHVDRVRTISGSVSARPGTNRRSRKVIRLMPKSIKVKKRGTVRFVVDDYMNILGMVPAQHVKGLKWDQVITRDKFLILTMNKRNEDPRGKSTYRPAYNWYNLKTNIPSEMLRYILQETVPQAVGTLPPETGGYLMRRDADGNIVYRDPPYNTEPEFETPAESMARQIEGFRGGSGAVIPYEAKLEPFKKGLTGSNDAHIFSTILKIIDDQMENAMLLQVLAQSEGEHQARAASQQVAELLYNLTFWVKISIATMTLNDLLKVAVRLNLGEEYVKYLPQVSLGDFVRRDWASDLSVVSEAYFRGFIDDSQRQELCAWLNLPKPGPSRQELNQNAVADRDVNGEPVQPSNNRPDKQPGNQDRNSGNGTEKSNGQDASNGFNALNLLGHHGRRFRSTARYIPSDSE